MIKKPIRGLISLGYNLFYLKSAEEGDFISPEDPDEGKLVLIKSAIEKLLEQFGEYSLNVTTRAANELMEFYDSIKEKEVGSRLTKDEALRLRKIITILELTLMAESKGIECFFATDKYIPLEKLTEQQSELFMKGVFDELSELAQHDIREAGMCLAFERSTASAFHILRATEDVLRDFYCRIVKQHRVKKYMWGNMTADLSKRRKRPSDITMKNLDYIRENFRNPTAHPEARYDIDEARALFNLCIDVITRMVRDPLWNKR